MKKKFILLSLITLLTGCSFENLNSLINNSFNSNSNSSVSINFVTKGTINIWTDNELVDFYKEKLFEFRINNLDFVYDFDVKGMDLIEASNNAYIDPDNAADIFTTIHQQIGKLAKEESIIAPIQNDDLLEQIESYNIDTYKNVIKSDVSGESLIYGAPYSLQSLVLYYNKEKVSEEQVKTWEGIMEASMNLGSSIKATTNSYNDMYNFSWPLLSKKALDGSTSLRLYEEGKEENCSIDGDDTVAVMKWAQKFYNHPNGGAIYDGINSWETELMNENALSFIGGSWHYQAAKSALGNKLGIAKLPTFTLTKESEYGSIQSGTTYQAASFTDCKVFVINKNSEYLEYLSVVVKYLTSKEIQEEAYEKYGIVPSYKNADIEFKKLQQNSLQVKLDRAEIEMSKYGIAQPFRADLTLENRFYSPKVEGIYNAIISNENGYFSTFDQIKSGLTEVENYLITGKYDY